MRITKYKKLNGGKYKVTLDNNNELTIYEEVILNNNLLLIKDITIDILNKVLEDNIFYEVYNLSLNYIGIKMRSVKELKTYLLKKNYDETIINKVIDRIQSEGYINDKLYIECFVNDKVNLTIWGPYKIRKYLLDLELDSLLIDNKINSISNDIWKDKVIKIVNKKLKLLSNKSLYMVKNKLKIDLFNLGYDNELINDALNNLSIDNLSNIKKEYEKVYNKYSKKYNEVEVNNKIRNYLYRKGYSIEEINSVINE